MSQQIQEEYQNLPEDPISFRDPSNLEGFPELNDIRSAAIAFYDFLIESKENEPWLFETFSKDLEEIGSTDEENKTNDFEELTKLRCGISNEYVLHYLDFHFPDRYELFEISVEGGLRHFGDHTMSIIRSKDSGLWFAFSFGNIFNEDFGFPETSAHVYQRSNEIFIGKDAEEVLRKVKRFEGGDWNANNLFKFISSGRKSDYKMIDGWLQSEIYADVAKRRLRSAA